MKAIVNLPPGEDLNDWVAVHVVDFFNRINLIYGTVSDFCTKEVFVVLMRYFNWVVDSSTMIMNLFYNFFVLLAGELYVCIHNDI